MTKVKTVATQKTTPVMMRLPEDLVNRVDELANSMYISRNSAFCQALGYWCDTQEVQKSVTSSDFVKNFLENNPEFVKGCMNDE